MNSIIFALLVAFGVNTQMPNYVTYKEIEKRQQTITNNFEIEKAKKSELSDQFLQVYNKDEDCKVVMKDFDALDGFTVYWDGQCKNGYADGIGREFLFYNGKFVAETIVEYANSGEDYAFYMYNDSELIYEGVDSLGVLTHLASSSDTASLVFDIGQPLYSELEIAYARNIEALDNYSATSKLEGSAGYLIQKSYNIVEGAVYRASEVIMNYDMNKLNENGYGFEIYESGNVDTSFAVDGDIDFYAEPHVPIKYLKMFEEIETEANKAVQEGLEAQKIALEIISTYTSKICAKKEEVADIDNRLYYNICDRNKDFLALEANFDKSWQKLVNDNMNEQKEKQKEDKSYKIKEVDTTLYDFTKSQFRLKEKY